MTDVQKKIVTDYVFYYPAQRSESRGDFVAFGVTIEAEDTATPSELGFYIEKANGSVIYVRNAWLWYESSKREIILKPVDVVPEKVDIQARPNVIPFR